MLPEVLSNGLCSLRPDEDRLVFSVLADVDPTGRVRRVRFQKSIIRSRARLTYREAFARLRGRAGDEISRKLHDAWSLASLLRERRFRGGSLDLDFPEVKVWLDERGRAERIERVENDISHQMIEELMLLANELVARELKQARQPAVYRIHEHPEADRLEELRVTAGIFGLKCGDLTRRTELQRLLAGARGKPFEHALKVALLKSLKRARYAPQPLGHYGLHKSDYTHFTSPIRRYADLVVHRALARHIGIGRKGAPSSELEALAEHISRSERAASDAERESVRMKKLEYFRRQIEEGLGEIFAARILEVRNFGLFVELPDVLLSGLVHISAIHGDFFDFDAVRRRLVGRKSRRAFQAGDEIRVVTSRVDMFKQQVDFVPV
jgi:ribonuclease R